MDAATRNLVRRRARHRCEYCGLARETVPSAIFHIEHVIPKKHGGSDDSSNLAFACYRCNLHKGPNLTGIDPASGNIVVLFHPRRDVWQEHFAVQGPVILGQTAIGRATVRVLEMNSPERLRLRAELG